jgi:cell division protein FtsB
MSKNTPEVPEHFLTLFRSVQAQRDEAVERAETAEQRVAELEARVNDLENCIDTVAAAAQ